MRIVGQTGELSQWTISPLQAHQRLYCNKGFTKNRCLIVLQNNRSTWALCEIINVTVDTLYFLIFDLFLNLDFTINEISWDFTQDPEFMKLRDLGLEAGFKVPSVIFIQISGDLVISSFQIVLFPWSVTEAGLNSIILST